MKYDGSKMYIFHQFLTRRSASMKTLCNLERTFQGKKTNAKLVLHFSRRNITFIIETNSMKILKTC